MEQEVLMFNKGMHRDASPRSRPEGTYYDALNLVLESAEGDMLVAINELGNSRCLTLPRGYKVIGAINTDTDDIIVFSTDGTNSEIGILDSGCCEYRTYINTTCLGFQHCNLIKGIYKVRRGCERIIYFTDKVNPLRVINLDKLTDYNDENGNFDCNQTSLLPEVYFPAVNVIGQNTGGQLPLGAYSFAFRYIDNLDNDLGWSTVTTPININDDALSDDWESIDGGLNSAYYSAEEGGLPLTNKSIRIDLTELDQSYSKIQIAVVKSIQGIGTITAIDLLQEVNYSSSSVSYTYTGADSQVLEQLSTNEFEVDKADIQVVHTIAQLDNTLWLANIKTAPYDYAAFQQAANNIVIKPVVQQVPAYDATAKYNSKNYKNRSAMGGDVEDFGIVYVLKNGTKLPVLHIPGREAFDHERTILRAWNPNMAHIVDEETFNNTYATTEEEYNADPSKPIIRNYEICPIYTENEFLYYENKFATYPLTENCEGEYVWGDLAGQPIRHHRFPTRSSIPLVEYINTALVTNVFGIEVSNITYPHPDIVGHIIVRAKKTSSDIFIQDKAITFQSYNNGTQVVPGSRPANSVLMEEDQVLNIFSPSILVNKLIPSFNHLQIEGEYDLEENTLNGRFDTPGFFTGDIHLNVRQLEGNGFVSSDFSQCKIGISSKALVSFNSVQTAFGDFNSPLFNTFQNDKATFLKVIEGGELTHIENGEYISPILTALYTGNEVFTNLSALVYEPIMDNIVYDNSTHITYDIPTSAIFPMEIPLLENYDSGSSFLDSREFWATHIKDFFIESPYNLSYKHGGTNKCNTIPRNYSNILFYFVELFADMDESTPTDWLLRDQGNQCQNFWGYNLDYSKTVDNRVMFPLSENYDYCSKCLNHFPNRLYYSLRDDLESVGDNYRNILANNYRTLDTTGDYFTALVTDKSELYALSNAYVYFIPTKTQQLQSDENTVYIGTGARLSVPPAKLVSTDYRYGGTKEDFTIVKTPFGVVYADAQAGSVYLLRDSIQEISNQGMRSFFERELTSNWNKLVRLATGRDWKCINSTVDDEAVGYIATYDPRTLTYKLSKKDFKLASGIVGLFFKDPRTLPEPNKAYIDEDGQLWGVDRLRRFYKITVNDVEYFMPFNYTISYSFLAQAWTSFHSYGYYGFNFNNHNTFFTSRDNVSWEHNKGEYQNFYGEVYPYFVETISNQNPNLTKIFDSVYIASEAYRDNESDTFYKDYVDKTFDAFWIYTHKQSTGLVTLLNEDNMTIPTSGSEVSIRQIKDKYYFNNIRNRLGALPSFGYTSPHRNVANIVSYNMLNDARIKGDYAYFRFYYNNPDNSKIATHNIAINYTNSNR